MATKIRLARFGRKKRPFYRIAVADSRFPRDGRNIEFIGYYDPLSDPVTLEIKREKAIGWLGEGAIPSTTVKRIFSSQGIMLEFDLKKNGKSDEVIKEELQKFDMLQELKLKNKQAKAEKKKAEKAKAAAEEETEKTAEAAPKAEETPVKEAVVEAKAKTEAKVVEEPPAEATAEPEKEEKPVEAKADPEPEKEEAKEESAPESPEEEAKE